MSSANIYRAAFDFCCFRLSLHDDRTMVGNDHRPGEPLCYGEKFLRINIVISVEARTCTFAINNVRRIYKSCYVTPLAKTLEYLDPIAFMENELRSQSVNLLNSFRQCFGIPTRGNPLVIFPTFQKAGSGSHDATPLYTISQEATKSTGDKIGLGSR